MSSRFDRGNDPGGDYVLVARGVRPHGIRGELKIAIHSDVVDRFVAGAAFSALIDGARRRFVIDAFRPVRGGGLVSFRGIESREQAETFRDVDFEVGRAEVPPSPDGQYYFFELIGCHCVDVGSGDLGVVKEVIEDGGGILLAVDSESGTILIPFATPFLESVDTEISKIHLRLPEGLVELCTSKS